MWNRLFYTVPGYLFMTLDFLRKTLMMNACQKSAFNPWSYKTLAGNPGEQAVSGYLRTTAASSKERWETIVMQLFCLIHYSIPWKYSPLATNKMDNPYPFFFTGGNILRNKLQSVPPPPTAVKHPERTEEKESYFDQFANNLLPLNGPHLPRG